MRGPRIRRIHYVTRAARELAQVLAPLTSPTPHDYEWNRWCARLARTRDWQRLRFTERGVHIANNAVVSWCVPTAIATPAFLDALRVARDCAREGLTATRETLAERGLYPWAVGDATAPRWLCEACDGRGSVGGGWAGTEPQDADVCDTCAREDLDATGGITADGTTDDPPSLPALVAVAALGAERLHTIASVVTELRRVTRVDGVPTLGDRVVWRVMTREALEDAVRSNLRSGDEALPDGSYEPRGIAHAWAVEGALVGLRRSGSRAFREAWPEACPWTQADLRAAWSMLRTLALDCGVHLLDADARRVVIGVEAL